MTKKSWANGRQPSEAFPGRLIRSNNQTCTELIAHIFAGLLLLTIFPSIATSQEDPRLAELLKPLISAHEGTVTVAVKHLTTGVSFLHNADEPMPTASLIKFPIMITAYQQAADGKLDLSSNVELKETDKVPGSGILTSHFSSGLQFPLRDAIRLMIAYSDNTATNIVLDKISLNATTELMLAQGFPNTRLHSKVYLAATSIAPDRSEKFGLGSTTASEMVRLLEKLDKKELASPDASGQMYEHLRACQDQPRLARSLPKGTKVALKTGSVSAARNGAGIIESPSGHIAICVLTSKNKDQRWEDDNAAELLCAEITRLAYDYFNAAGTAETNPISRELVQGASGELVEALQRTVRKRVPGSRLSVDGDFGPATRQAVITFQRSQNLPPTGIVTAETWKALGPLIQADEEKPVDPELVNKETLPQTPADSITGPPFVTANSWAIGEAKTGRILWHEKGDERRDFASTTKTMTAWLILREAEKEPRLLDEIISFPSAADRTGGSTCGLKTGERISVRDLIYGLMLPSGNDAAVALAEFAGPRFAAERGSPDAQKPLARFVAEMNRTADELGMKQTHYSNPHGLPDKLHLSTAVDQLLLTAKVMQDARFRDYVQTRQHAVRVQGPGGTTRTVVWKNGNELLKIAGYSGVKTGTTDAAGACLISVGRHLEDELIVVVLGCSSNESRYVDTRNLFRWSWQQRGHLN
jgi:serine-type D-Ala-D-Ala carboxypeptidase (penicillin-binding protein 5/6)